MWLLENFKFISISTGLDIQISQSPNDGSLYLEGTQKSFGLSVLTQERAAHHLLCSSHLTEGTPESDLQKCHHFQGFAIPISIHLPLQKWKSYFAVIITKKGFEPL